VVKHLFAKGKALDLIPRTTKKKRRKQTAKYEKSTFLVITLNVNELNALIKNTQSSYT
jgi:hypothetical protein